MLKDLVEDFWFLIVSAKLGTRSLGFLIIKIKEIR